MTGPELSARIEEKPPVISTFVDRFANIHGVTPNPTRVFTHPYSVAFEDASGTTNVFACDHEAKFSGYRPASGSAYLLRGLLSHRREIVTLDDTGREFLTEAVPTTRVLNNTVQTLGLTPGVDAFKFVQYPGRGRFPLGEWVRSLAAMQVPQADIDSEAKDIVIFSERPTKIHIPAWDMARHDLIPSNHIIQWILTSQVPTVRDAIVEGARSLVDKFGMWHSAELEREPAPEEVRNFSVVTDKLDVLMRMVYESVTQIDEADPLHLEQQLKKVNYTVNHGYRNYSMDFYRYSLTTLGLIPEKASDDEVIQKTTAVFAEYAGATSSMFRRLEDIRPHQADTAEQKAARITAWETITNTYTPDAMKESK